MVTQPRTRSTPRPKPIASLRAREWAEHAYGSAACVLACAVTREGAGGYEHSCVYRREQGLHPYSAQNRLCKGCYDPNAGLSGPNRPPTYQ